MPFSRPPATRTHRSPRRRRGRGSWRAAERLESRWMLAADVAAEGGQTTGVLLSEPGASDNYTLLSPNTSTFTYLIDKQGEVVHQWESDYLPGLIGYLLDDGSLIRASSPNGQGGNGSIQALGAGGLFERFDWEGNLTWQFSYDSPTYLAHHDFEVMPNGNILLIAWELKSYEEAIQAGRHPSLLALPTNYLYPDSIVEVAPDLENGGGQIVWQWHAWDHLVQQWDPDKDNYLGPTGVSDHPERIDINFTSADEFGGSPIEDWTHFNSIDYNAELDQILISVREFSEIWVIDHSTTTAEAAGHTGGRYGKGGDLLYRWGNPQAYGRGTSDDRILYYQHDAQWIADELPGAGNFLLFNNGFGRPGDDFSEVIELTPPADQDGIYPALAAGQAHEPVSPSWVYQAPTEKFSPVISGAQRLNNGNTLISYGVLGKFTEIDSTRQEVWEYVNPYTGTRTLGPTETIPSLELPQPGLDVVLINFTFRALDYPRDYIPQLQPQLIGDANGDGNVGAADYTIWAAQFDDTGDALAADFNQNGTVGLGDYTLWAANFGNSIESVTDQLAVSESLFARALATSPTATPITGGAVPDLKPTPAAAEPPRLHERLFALSGAVPAAPRRPAAPARRALDALFSQFADRPGDDDL